VLVDHIKAAKSHPELFFQWRNLRALCQQCHNQIGEKVLSKGVIIDGECEVIGQG
jgi:5-methylcytosine-specific restriction endonuclease McrA